MSTATTTTGTGTGSMATRSVHDGWTVRVVAGPAPEQIVGHSFAATVPGSVHTDLLAAGLIADPYLDDNERLQAWIGACDWEYFRVER
jgi:beta-mannosidase